MLMRCVHSTRGAVCALTLQWSTPHIYTNFICAFYDEMNTLMLYMCSTTEPAPQYTFLQRLEQLDLHDVETRSEMSRYRDECDVEGSTA